MLRHRTAVKVTPPLTHAWVDTHTSVGCSGNNQHLRHLSIYHLELQLRSREGSVCRAVDKHSAAVSHALVVTQKSINCVTSVECCAKPRTSHCRWIIRSSTTWPHNDTHPRPRPSVLKRRNHVLWTTGGRQTGEGEGGAAVEGNEHERQGTGSVRCEQENAQRR